MMQYQYSRTVDDAEYVLGIVIVGSYGLFVYVNVGAEKGLIYD